MEYLETLQRKYETASKAVCRFKPNVYLFFAFYWFCSIVGPVDAETGPECAIAHKVEELNNGKVELVDQRMWVCGILSVFSEPTAERISFLGKNRFDSVEKGFEEGIRVYPKAGEVVECLHSVGVELLHGQYVVLMGKFAARTGEHGVLYIGPKNGAMYDVDKIVFLPSENEEHQ